MAATARPTADASRYVAVSVPPPRRRSGATAYFTTGRHLFQFLIVICAWIELILTYAKVESRWDGVLGSIRAFRPVVFLTFQPDIKNIYNSPNAKL